MSRCFPYPPPGYERHSTTDETLIESIKIQNKREKIKKERRKEKKREKKENKKTRETREIDNKGHELDKRHKIKVDERGANCQKTRNDETEQLEKSDTTEEFGQPVSLQNLNVSSDSSQESKRRKKSIIPSVGTHEHGSVLRIRLLLQKHKDPEASPRKEQPCCISGTIGNPGQDDNLITREVIKEQPCSTSGRTEFVDQRPASGFWSEQPQPCSTSTDRAEILSRVGVQAAPAFSLWSGNSQIESQYRDLMEKWVSPNIQNELTEVDEQEWLFDTRGHNGKDAKRFKASSACGSIDLYPRACYLPVADIHALPFTVPF